MRRLLPGALLLALLLPSRVALAQDGALHVYLDEDGKEIVSTALHDELELVEVILPEKRAPPSSPKKLPARMRPYADMVARVAPEYGLDVLFVMAVIEAESGFDPDATSSVGAMGLMQLMPSNAKRFGLDDPYDPEQNITGGCMLLAQLMERYEGDVAVVLAAYSAGDVHVTKAGGVPSFSVNYIARVIRAHARIKALYEERTR